MKILVIDDDIGAMEPLIELLRSVGGHSVQQLALFSDGRTAIDSARELGRWAYDLLILDVHLNLAPFERGTEAQVAGLDLLDRFRLTFPAKRVLILTNALHRVPQSLIDGQFTKALDKVEVAGRRLLNVITDW